MPMGEETHQMAVKVATALRNAGHQVVLETNKKSFGSMFKYASRNNFEYAVMIGEEELKENKVKVKNLKTQDQYFVSLDKVLGGNINDELM